MNSKIGVRDVLMSSGNFTKEVVIITKDKKEIYESSPEGFTIGLKELKKSDINKEEINLLLSKLYTTELTQKEFDKNVASKFGVDISTALSLTHLRYLSHTKGFKNQKLFEFISRYYSKNKNISIPICNILNGGKHAGNGLDMCEFMIIPQGKDAEENIRIASEVYLDLQNLIKTRLGQGHCMVGREGGFAPNISDVKFAISLIQTGIDIRNKDKCGIALDVAANNFALKQNNKYYYILNSHKYTTQELVEYYMNLIKEFPNIIYLEDPFHEEDISGWKKLNSLVNNKILIVADDLTTSNIKYLKKYLGCFNSCILKCNQIGNITDLVESFNFCLKNNIKTIISQRSGETDSSILTHLSIGLGADYIKAGAPARERIIKYNELLMLKNET
ncbi:MAG: hypothetical protein ACOCRX_05665 [Candidatus Woesearchaeota archaeon]